MRELKFRAWDNKAKSFVNPGCVFINLEGSVCAESEEDGTVCAFSDQTALTIEQFTGRSDKNGREIYEGDIIKSISRDEYFDEVKVTDKVELVASLNTYIDTLSWIPCHGEVIGNIHENKELLDA